MPSEKILAAKKQVVADLVASCKDSASFVFVAARGLTVLQDTEMRSELRKNNVTYKVVKNTTLRLVFKELGIEGLDDMLVGPTAVAYSDDIIAPAKVQANYAEKIAVLEIKGGIIEGKAASKSEIETLAKIPSKEVLYSQVVYGLLYPITKLAMLIKAVAEKDGASAPEAATEDVAPVAEEAPVAEAEAPVEAAPVEG